MRPNNVSLREAARTLFVCDGDINQDGCNALAGMVDAAGLRAVLETLADICTDKATTANMNGLRWDTNRWNEQRSQLLDLSRK